MEVFRIMEKDFAFGLEKKADIIRRLHEHIPISAHMQVEIGELTRDSVTLTAPLEPNLNHARTAFGGSVHSLAVLSCWSLVSLTVESEGFGFEYVVIQDSQINYQKPIEGDFEATSSWASGDAREKFVGALRRKGLARVQLTSSVQTGGNVCATLAARFVAHVSRANQ